jgi:hydroxymethylpyrimidine/phosphomethylpyrimidine kinase
MSATMRCALAIGGLDPGGGAGLAADLRAFAAAGAFGCAAAALYTIQSTAGLVRVVALPAREVTAQAREVLANQDVRAVKVGALGSAQNVRAVASLLRARPRLPAIVDTPMLPSRGRRTARLLDAGAVDAVREALVPLATLVTVNAAEAAVLVGVTVESTGDAHDAALAICRLGARAALVKGGHVDGAQAIDVLAEAGGRALELRARRLASGAHGTGCTLASLIAGRIAARGDGVVEATKWAKRVHHAALSRAARIGRGAAVIPLG